MQGRKNAEVFCSKVCVKPHGHVMEDNINKWKNSEI